jgi:hypothetical protein
MSAVAAAFRSARNNSGKRNCHSAQVKVGYQSDLSATQMQNGALVVGQRDHATSNHDRAVVEAVADPAVRKRLTAELGQDIPSRAQQTPEALYAYQKAEIEKWWPLIKAANIRPE